MNGPMSRPNNAAAIRGALLVIAAVVVGIYLLLSGMQTKYLLLKKFQASWILICLLMNG